MIKIHVIFYNKARVSSPKIYQNVKISTGNTALRNF